MGETPTDTSVELPRSAIGEGGTDTATLTVTVTGENDQPALDTAQPDQTSNDGETIAPVDISGNFSDVDASDTLTFSASGLPTGLSIDTSTGVISGTIDDSASQSSPHTVTVTADDGSATANATQTDTFQWTVNNLDPTATDNSAAVTEDGPTSASGNVIDDDDGSGTDSDPEDPASQLIVSAVGGNAGDVGSGVTGSHGTVTINSDGGYTYNLDNASAAVQALAAGETLTDTFSYEVSDQEGGTDTADLTVTITGTNDAPTRTTARSTRRSDDGESINIDLSTAFNDVDTTDTLTFSVTSGGLPPGLSMDSDGVVTGDIDFDASTGGPYNVTVTATDSDDDGNPTGTSVASSFTWTVNNPAPVADNDTDTVDQGGSISRPADGVLDNDEDGAPDGDPLDVTQIGNGNVTVAAGANIAGDNGGVFTIAADGAYDFDTAGDFVDVQLGGSRTTTVTYTVSDSEGGTDAATLTVTVGGDNDAPTTTGLSDEISDDGETASVATADAFSDVDANDELSFSASNLPPGLSIDTNTGEISGTIDFDASQGSPNSDGVYEVTVTAADGNGGSVDTTFEWTVTNPAPVAGDDADTTDEDAVLTVAADGVIDPNDVDTRARRRRARRSTRSAVRQPTLAMSWAAVTAASSPSTPTVPTTSTRTARSRIWRWARAVTRR
ncbi:MAG: putative Ig domain-containing protein [Halofilum sp. (in: g-proteobacteria)]|nr:putative Ig domain-containing protein [Halofilum sp. (in: g-proteobacteria)]